MIYLLLVSIIWAFSFGLIKTNLATIDPVLVTVIRLFFASIVFLPFLRIKKLNKSLCITLLIIGSIQFGLMYIFYNIAFQYLKAYEVALFTIFTPIFVSINSNIMDKKWNNSYILTSIMAIIGTGIIVQTQFNRPGLIGGFLIVQLSNLCFAFGQVRYRKIMRAHENISDKEIFAIPYLGGLLTAALISIFFVQWNSVIISPGQWLNLIYLGILASGFGFFMWNLGARRTNIGALAIFNNLKIPLSISVSLVFFQEKANLPNLIIGGVIVLIALLTNEIIEKQKILAHG